MKISAFVDFFIGQHRFEDQDEIKRARIFVRACLLTSLFSNAYIWLSALYGFDKGAYAMAFSFIGFLLLSFFARSKLPITLLGNLFIATGATSIFFLTYFSGGIWSGVYIWVIAIPVLALFVVNRLSGIVWAIISLLVMVYFSVSALAGIEFPVEYSSEFKTQWFIAVVPGVLMIVTFISLLFERMQTNALMESQSKNKLLKSQKETITRQSKKLEQHIEEKNHIIRILAHDLRGPLKNIDSLVNLAKNNVKSSDTDTYIDMIAKSSLSAQNLVDKVLEMDAAEQEDLKVDWESLNVVQVLSKVIDSMNETASLKNIAIQLDDSSLQSNVKADKVYLELIFKNLLSNAIKFSEKNTKVIAKISSDNNYVQIAIIDEGPGIPQEEANLLFKKFQKLSTRPTANETSTGLGLSLVKRYVELINGKVWYDGSLAPGACFIVELPKIK